MKIFYSFAMIAFLGVLVSCSSKKVAQEQAKDKKSLHEEMTGIPKEVAEEVFDKAEITNENAPKLEDASGGAEAECVGSRKTIGQIKNMTGTVQQSGSDFLFIGEDGRTYLLCELDRRFKSSGLQLVVSGDVLEKFMAEPIAGSPVRITEINEAK